MKTEDLVKAAANLNKLLFDENKKEDGWIDENATRTNMKEQIRDAALFLEIGDVLEKETVAVLKEMKWKESDFINLEEDQDPMPLFLKYNIIEESKEEAEEKPKKKTAKKKVEEPVEEVPKEPEPEDEEEVEEEPEPEDEEEVEEEPVPEDEKEVEAEEYLEEPERHLDEPVLKKTKQVVDGSSSYSTALAMMSTDPDMSMARLYDIMKAKGFDLSKTGNSIKTARSAFRRVYVLLDRQDRIKKK